MRRRLTTIGVPGLALVVAVWLISAAGAAGPSQTPPGKAGMKAGEMQGMQMGKPNPEVGRALATLVKAKKDLGAAGSYHCCIKPECNFCALAADKCPCADNVKTPMGVCGECFLGWKAGAGHVEGVDPNNVKLIGEDMAKMMYQMRGPREEMVSGGATMGKKK